MDSRRFFVSELLSRRSAYGANTCTSAALYASVSVDNVFSVAF